MSATTAIRSDPERTVVRRARPPAWRRFVAVVARSGSYRRIAYLLLGLPLGTLWFTALVTALSASISLVVVALVGIPMLWATWSGVRVFANVERRVAGILLDRDLPPAPLDPGHGNVWVRLKGMSRDGNRWRELGFLLLRFPAGIATSTIAVTALTTPVAVALAPIRARTQDHPFGEWALSSDMEAVAASPWAWLLVPLAAAMFVGAFHLLGRLADACGTWTVAWLRHVL